MATGNMFRKPRSMSRPQNPMGGQKPPAPTASPRQSFQFNPLNPVASTAEYLGMRIANPQNPGSPAGMRRRQAIASMLGYEPPVQELQPYQSPPPTQQAFNTWQPDQSMDRPNFESAARRGPYTPQNPMGVFGGGPPVPGGRAYADRLLPEQRYYMQQQNPFSPQVGSLGGNVPLRGPATPQQRNDSVMLRMDGSNAANAQFNQKFPSNPTSSFDASRMAAGRTANNAYQSGVANGYANPLDSGLDPRSLDEREKLARANAAYMMGGGPTSDPTNLAGRFGGAPAVSQESRDAQARMARGQASDQLLGSLVMQGRQSPQMGNMLNPMYKGPFAKRQADGSNAYTNREGAFHDAFPGLANPATRDATLQRLMETNPEAARAYQVDRQDREQRRAKYDARVQKFKDEHGGMSARQFGIQSRQDKRENARYRKAIMQGLNPMSPQAQGLFPDQTKKFMADRQANRGAAVQNPLSSPMAADKPRTAENFAAANDALKLRVTGVPASETSAGYAPDPFLTQTIGLTPEDMSPTAAQQGLFSVAQSGSVDITPGDVRKLQEVARTAKKKPSDEDPFVFHSVWNDTSPHQTKDFGPLWQELHDIPDNAPDSSFTSWYDKYRGIVKSKYGGK